MNPGEQSRHRTEEVVRHMADAESAPPPSIEEALHEAVEKHRMSPSEAQECLEAYIACFNKSKELYGE